MAYRENLYNPDMMKYFYEDPPDGDKARYLHKRAVIMVEMSEVAKLQALLRIERDPQKRKELEDKIVLCRSRIYYIQKTP